MQNVTRSSTPDPSPRKTLLRQASNRLLRSISSPAKTETMASAMPSQQSEEHVMDTRTPSPLPRTGSTAEVNEYRPDLSQEVAMLSTKLINAINFQTTLDDQLQQTRHELEMSQRQFAKLQAEKKYLDDMIKDGILVRSSAVNPVIESLKAELNVERNAREVAERSKKQTEAELESLTSALFEEANEMVAAARKESEAAEKRNSQLKSKLSDTEVLLASQQEQLQDLKLTMERMSERGDNDITRNSVPSTPIHPPAGLFDGLPMSMSQTMSAEIPPEHPLFFSSLLVPVLRSDVAAYNDFQELLQAARRAAGHLRSSSNGQPQERASSNSFVQLTQFSGSSPNLPGAFSFSTSSSPGASQPFSPPLQSLKDTKFYKRTLMEDIEPTLRLDQAPGLSFLSRRGVLSSLLQGSLVVEPFVAGGKFVAIYACALCGESRKTDQYARKHRFRTSDEESAQRYPLCDYCLGRIRASGDFITFLRMVRDGYWHADTEDEQKGAWEESVRLRERMFWARIGGGVVLAAAARNATPSTSAVKSPRESLEDTESKPVELTLTPRDDTEPSSPPGTVKRVSLDQKLVEVFQRHRKSMSISRILPDFTPSGELPPQPAGISDGAVKHPDKSIDELREVEEPARTTPQAQDASAATNNREVRPTLAPITTVDSAANEELLRTPRSSTASLTRIQTGSKMSERSNSIAERPASLESRRTSSSTAASRSPDRKQTGVLARVRAMEAQNK